MSGSAVNYNYERKHAQWGAMCSWTLEKNGPIVKQYANFDRSYSINFVRSTMLPYVLYINGLGVGVWCPFMGVRIINNFVLGNAWAPCRTRLYSMSSYIVVLCDLVDVPLGLLWRFILAYVKTLTISLPRKVIILEVIFFISNANPIISWIVLLWDVGIPC